MKTNPNAKAIVFLDNFIKEIELSKRADELASDPEVKRIARNISKKTKKALKEWKEQKIR